MKWGRLLILIVFLASLSPAYAAVCNLPNGEVYPGWTPRFNASLATGDVLADGVNGTVGMKDISVEVTNILSGKFANLLVSKKGVYSEEFSVSESTDNFDITLEDIRVKVVSITAASVNLTVYTHNQAIVNTTTNLTYKSTDMNASLPGEVVEIESVVKNIGELEALDLQINEVFGEFQVVSKEVPIPTSFCANNTFTVKYELLVPADLKKDTNYTLTIEFTYSDYNAQLLSSRNRSQKITLVIVVTPTQLTVSKGTGNWTLLNTGRELTITDTVRNPGNTTAINVKLIDTPPADLTVVSGQPSLNLGSMDPGDVKNRAYTVISNDPIYCYSSAGVEYEDTAGNSYTAFSDPAGVRFSPFVTMTKTIRDSPLPDELSYGYPIKTRQSMKSNYSSDRSASANFTADAIMKTFKGVPYYSLCQGAFLNGSNDKCIDKAEPKILINQSVEVTVELKNMGNTLARGVRAREIFENIDSAGETSWTGTLGPGETASYSYFAVPTTRNVNLSTVVTYEDVDPQSLETSDVEGAGVGVCTKKLKNIEFSSSGNFSTAYPDLKLVQPGEIKIYEGSSFDFFPIIFNNGTDKIYDVEVTHSFGGLALIQGQKTTTLDELGRGFAPFKESSCNKAEWDNVNLTRTVQHSRLGAGKSTLVYEIKDGVIRVYVDDALTSHTESCEDQGLVVTVKVPNVESYPFHVPPEPSAASTSTEEIKFTIFGNPYQKNLAFLAPAVENQTYIPIITTVTYYDFYGNQYVRRFTTDVLVVPSTATYAIVRKERTDMAVVINYTNLTDIGEPGKLNFGLESTGFAAIDKFTLNITFPPGIEVATNDTNWTGRIEAQIKRANDTLYIFSGAISREGNISQGGKVILPLILRGLASGPYEIPYRIGFDGKLLEGVLDFRVRGPVIEGSKELLSTSVKEGDKTVVTVKIRNTGDGDAFNIRVVDSVPGGVQVVSGDTSIDIESIAPGEEAELTYTVTSGQSVDLGGTSITWDDKLGNSFITDLAAIRLTVTKPSPPPTETPGVTETPAPMVETPKPIVTTPPRGRLIPTEIVKEREAFEFSTREGVSALALTLVVVIIVLKLITLKIPVKEEE